MHLSQVRSAPRGSTKRQAFVPFFPDPPKWTCVVTSGNDEELWNACSSYYFFFLRLMCKTRTCTWNRCSSALKCSNPRTLTPVWLGWWWGHLCIITKGSHLWWDLEEEVEEEEEGRKEGKKEGGLRGRETASLHYSSVLVLCVTQPGESQLPWLSVVSMCFRGTGLWTCVRMPFAQL